MKVSFDGARRTLAAEFNEMVEDGLDSNQVEVMARMRNTLIAFLCMYDDDDPDDINDLSSDVELSIPQ